MNLVSLLLLYSEGEPGGAMLDVGLGLGLPTALVVIVGVAAAESLNK